MDLHRHQGVHTNGGTNTQNASRVYINPNFQRDKRVLGQNTMRSIRLEPNQHNNLQPLNMCKTKIYVNPNFVRTSASIRQVSEDYLTSASGDVMLNAPINSYYTCPSVQVELGRKNVAAVPGCSYAATSTSANICYVNSSHSTMTAVTSMINLPNVTSNVFSNQYEESGVAKSRYSLVRQYKDPVKITAIPNNRTVTKMKISKYKTVSVDHSKNQHDVKDKFSFVMQPEINSYDKTKRPQFIQSRFKLVKKNTGITARKLEPRTPIKRKYSLNVSKVLLKSTQKPKVAPEISKFKKNNIPCPLYRKYGTCLRNSRGKCEFLHDKKHVSICRKFLKGICHDKTCLLSHEATAEKMPTCYFYLKGMCTKENCPYLHIKLNEKANICLDFLKGFCEKGDKCLNRHVNICQDQATKGVCSRRDCPYPHRPKKKYIINNRVKTRVLKQSIKSKINNKTKNKSNLGEKRFDEIPNVEEEKGQECRYYKEVVKEASTLEVIKPSRCKLGALPSYIQL